MQKAKFYIDDKFIITGRGLVLAGHIKEGEINIGNYIKFEYDQKVIKRKITGIELTSHSIHSEGIYDQKNTGIMIECKDAKEMRLIRESGLKGYEALIFKE